MKQKHCEKFNMNMSFLVERKVFFNTKFNVYSENYTENQEKTFRKLLTSKKMELGLNISGSVYA